MTIVERQPVPLHHADRFFIGGTWVEPASDAGIDVIDPATEEQFLRVPAAAAADVARAVAAAREAFDRGPWPNLTHAERADYLRRLGKAVADRAEDLGQIWPRESGALYTTAVAAGQFAGMPFDEYAALADTFPFEERARPTMGGVFGLLVREPVGVVGAIIPWNAPLSLISHKICPALLAGCTVVLKLSPEAPGEGYLVAEAAEAIGLPPGVLNVITAERDVSELLVRDPGVDKITFTGSTATGRRIASLCGERIARCTLELGGKSAAVILDDADLEAAAKTLARSECFLAGQVCSSLTRIVVSERRHDEFVDALAGTFSKARVGDPFDPTTQIGPLTSARQRDRVEGYIAKGVEEGAKLVSGGRRPGHLDRGWFVEPTVFAAVDNSSTIAQEEIFGPVLSVIPAAGEDDMVDIANDTIYGLNASVFTADVDRARDVARRLRSGTVGHNAWRTDFGMAFGGFKQSGIGREGGKEGLMAFLETKTVILEEVPPGYEP
jgi:acyl-CoA reductase-like NAD-dependent aldehyde dehydrogenase